MVWCPKCEEEVEADVHPEGGFSACTICGLVLEEGAYSADPMFAKGADGESEMVGVRVNERGEIRGAGRGYGGLRYGSRQVDSHQRTLERAQKLIDRVLDMVGMQGRRGREEVVGTAHRLYQLALNNNVTRGRRTELVAGACAYIACRLAEQPYMLIDFSDALQVNVYTLGAVFLELIKRLRWEGHHVLRKPVDPSLYIHRFVDALEFGRGRDQVAVTAMQLVKGMKRDWMHTGRHPSGLCGAAIWVSSLIHGYEKTRAEISAKVHVAEETVSRRVEEFALTAGSALTPEEFTQRGRQLDQETRELLEGPPPGDEDAEKRAGACEHVRNKEAAHFARGMCAACYREFVELAGSDRSAHAPPSFTRNVMKELEKAAEEDARAPPLPAPGDEEAGDAEGAGAGDGDGAQAGDGAEKLQADLEFSDDDEDFGPLSAVDQHLRRQFLNRARLDMEKQAEQAILARRKGAGGSDRGGQDRARGGSAAANGNAAREGAAAANGTNRAKKKKGGRPDKAEVDAIVASGKAREVLPGELSSDRSDDDLREELSDFDDDEAAMVIHTDEEAAAKRALWEELNRDWLEHQAKKKAAAAEAEAKAAAEAAAAASQKRGRGRPKGSKSRPKPDDLPPAEDAAMAARSALEYHKASSKINYEALDELFGDDDADQQTAPAGKDAPALGETLPHEPDPGAGAGGEDLGATQAHTTEKQSQPTRGALGTLASRGTLPTSLGPGMSGLQRSLGGLGGIGGLGRPGKRPGTMRFGGPSSGPGNKRLRMEEPD
ncbi:unnamed protein product [Pedinophyceae sp. YPF-701]|nr:unnamed protein product [Pedinophyceae sp. YPF-701]